MRCKIAYVNIALADDMKAVIDEPRHDFDPSGAQPRIGPGEQHGIWIQGAYIIEPELDFGAQWIVGIMQIIDIVVDMIKDLFVVEITANQDDAMKWPGLELEQFDSLDGDRQPSMDRHQADNFFYHIVILPFRWDGIFGSIFLIS